MRIIVDSHDLLEKLERLSSQLSAIQKQLDHQQRQLGKIVSDDAAIEAEVTILLADAAALKDAFATLNAEVAAGGAPSAQTMLDLKNAVDGITGIVPPPAVPPAAPTT